MKYTLLCQFAIAYAKHGWWVVKVPHRKKAPVGDGWEKQRLGSREIISTFNVDEKMNLGVILGASGVVDIDLDCEEARRLAGYLLPPTGMRFGRNAAPNSHWIYTATLNGERTKRYEGPDQVVICEIRCSIGSQTVFPPSVHESGDVIGFESKDDPAHVDVSKLRDAAGEVAAGSLLLRHYPNQGSRHLFAMAVAGGLLNARWLPERAERFIEAISTEAGDDEIEDRIAAVRTTQRAISEGREVIGWPRVAEVIDGSEPKQQYVSRIRRHLGIDQRQAIVVRAAADPPIDLETASTEPYVNRQASMDAINRMAETARKLRERGYYLARQVAEWLDRKGPEALFETIDHPIPYVAAALGISRSHLHKLGRIGRVLRCRTLCDNDVNISERAILPLARLLEVDPEAIPKALETAHKLAKADADREGRTKARPVRPKHTEAAVDEIIGPAASRTPKPVPAQRRQSNVGPHTAACVEIRKQIAALADAIINVPTIPTDLRESIERWANHSWCRR